MLFKEFCSIVIIIIITIIIIIIIIIYLLIINYWIYSKLLWHESPNYNMLISSGNSRTTE